MPWGIAAGVAGSVLGSVASSALSPGTSGGSSGGGPSYYIPTGLSTADQQWQAIQNQNYNNYMGKNLDQYGLQSLQAGINQSMSYGPGYQNAANAAGQGYTNAGTALTNLGNQDLATQQQLLGAGQNVYNLGLDPQNALYNRTYQQLQDQTGATNSMYGLGASGAGAGVANQALSNFNIDWQNNQLSRAAQGLSAYTGAATTAGQYGNAGANALTQAPQYTLQGGQLPYQTAEGLAAAQGQIANTYGQFLNQNVYGPGQAIQNQFIPYANYGQGAQSIPYQNQASGAGAAGALVGQGISSLGNNQQVQNTLGNAFSNYFSPATGSFSGGDFSGAFSSSPYYGGGGNSYGFTMS